MREHESRRTFLHQAALTAGALAVGRSAHADEAVGSRQATGVRVGEVSDTTAVVWVRLTAHGERNVKGMTFPGRVRATAEPVRVTVPVEDLEGACPGAVGRVRVRYSTKENLDDAVVTDWIEVTERSDFLHQFRLRNLRPGTSYYYASETAGPDGKPAHAPLRGRFETAPAADSVREVRFCVITCQGYHDRGHADGHPIYPSMLEFRPHFACLTGDLVYYDSDEPRAVTPRLARYHWERMFSLPRLREFTRSVSTYWLKDDHDTLDDDAWPGKKMGELTFEDGQRIFRQQAPMNEGPSYRTIRWGRDLQIWFTEGRDHRSPNNMADGPTKTIWGAEQKEWFKKTVKESTATWKVLVSPTPIVGPDRPKGKNDNHSNASFQHEGDEIRAWIRANVPDNFFVVCGDRHWQYHSVHPTAGVQEFSVGPASNQHAGGTPGENKAIHRYHRVRGGFLAVTVSRERDEAKITFELRDVDGKNSYTVLRRL